MLFLVAWLLLPVPSTPSGLTVVGLRPDTSRAIFVFSWNTAANVTSYQVRVVSTNASNPIWPTDYATTRMAHQLPGDRTFDTLIVANPAESSSVKLAIRACDSTGCSTFATKQFYLRRYYPSLTPGYGIRAAMLAAIGCAIPATGTKTCGPWLVVDDAGQAAGRVSVTVGPP